MNTCQMMLLDVVVVAGLKFNPCTMPSISRECLQQGKAPITRGARHMSTLKGCVLLGHKIIGTFVNMVAVHVLI